ncbi:MAG: helix-turn-helix domain-containing protein [Thermodesulfobacteriota bacterium]
MKAIQVEIRDLIRKSSLTPYKVAKAIGIDHASLYRSLADNSNLELKTMMKVLDYLGYEIRFIKSKRKEVKKGKSNLSHEKGKKRR